MTKQIGYTVSLKLKAVKVAEAISNRNAGKELGIKEKHVRDWRNKKTNYQEQCDLYSVKNLNQFFVH